VEEEKTERLDATGDIDGLDSSDGGLDHSIELAVQVIKQTLTLLRRLRERADATDAADAVEKNECLAAVSGVIGCTQKGALEISAKAAPDDTPCSAQAEPGRSEAASAASNKRGGGANHPRTARVDRNRGPEGSSASPAGSTRRPRGRRNEEASRWTP
jgi:hypothetical protein